MKSLAVEVLYADITDPNEDTVTMMWKQSFAHIRYYAVDTLGIQVGDDDNSQLKARTVEQQTSEFGEKMKMSSSDLRLLRSDDQLLWMRESHSPINAPDNLKPFLEKLKKPLNLNKMSSASSPLPFGALKQTRLRTMPCFEI